MPKIPVLSKTIKTDRLPDIRGFIQAMKDMGAKVSTKEGTIVIVLRLERDKACLSLGRGLQ